MASAPSTLLWDTGAPHQFDISGTENYTGYTSGDLSTTAAQDWVAAPFTITGGSATLTQVNADWYNYYGYSGAGATVNYKIWRRNGLSAPQSSDLVSSGTLGSYSQAGIDDPRIPVAGNGVLYQYPVNIPLSGGNYYISIYAAGPGNATLSWLAGADLQPEDAQWNGYWRSFLYPSPGFFSNTPAAVTAGTAMSDPLDRWNESFTLYGVPQYTTLPWSGTSGSSTSNWSAPANWGGSMPASGNVLEFGPLTTGSVNNLNNLPAGTQLNGLNFMMGAPSYLLTGNSLTMAGEVINLSYSSEGIGLGMGLVAGGGSIDTGAAGINVSGVIGGSGGITKLGSGVLLLSASNTYTGGTNLINGTVSVANSGALGITGSLTFSGGTLQYNGISKDFSGRISPIAAGQSAYIDTNGRTVSFASSISGSGSLTKLGAGTLTLTTSDSFTGGLDVAGGRLVLMTPLAVPDGSNLWVGSSAVASLGSPVVGSETISTSAPTSVPEPGALALLLPGLFLLFPRLFAGVWRRSRA
jgi:autotransporter-associated beta strand protein